MLNRYWPGRALPGGSPRVHLTPCLRLVCCSMAVAALGIDGSSRAYAQFPPPARPPKMATELKTPEKSAAPAELPTARAILDKHVAAIGGREAILSHSSTYAKGTLSMPSAGITGTLEVYGAKPNRTLVKSSIPGVGQLVEGFDGARAWSISPMTGPMILEGAQLEDKRFDSDFYSELRSADRYSSMTTLEQTDFEGRPCYKVRLVRKTGREDIEFYDVATGLKAGSITNRETPMGAMTVTTVEQDYRRFGNLLVPTMVSAQLAGVKQVITITSIEFDNVAASVFEPPAEIKALLK